MNFKNEIKMSRFDDDVNEPKASNHYENISTIRPDDYGLKETTINPYENVTPSVNYERYHYLDFFNNKTTLVYAYLSRI